LELRSVGLKVRERLGRLVYEYEFNFPIFAKLGNRAVTRVFEFKVMNSSEVLSTLLNEDKLSALGFKGSHMRLVTMISLDRLVELSNDDFIIKVSSTCSEWRPKVGIRGVIPDPYDELENLRHFIRVNGEKTYARIPAIIELSKEGVSTLTLIFVRERSAVELKGKVLAMDINESHVTCLKRLGRRWLVERRIFTTIREKWDFIEELIREDWLVVTERLSGKAKEGCYRLYDDLRFSLDNIVVANNIGLTKYHYSCGGEVKIHSDSNALCTRCHRPVLIHVNACCNMILYFHRYAMFKGARELLGADSEASILVK